MDRFSSATEWIRALALGEVSAQSATAQSLAVATETAGLGALIYLASESASRLSAALDKNAGASEGRRLRGLPIVIKDNIDVAGMSTTAGSPAFTHPRPFKSATAAARLIEAGAVVIGKANLHEFSLGITTNNGGYGPARNPYDPLRIPGGSSGGTAVAVASGMVSVALGSDTGGSLRIPAALCGVVGFRPSTGRWPSDGVVKVSWTRDTLGPIGRRVADCALLDEIVCQETNSLASVSIKGIRIGVPRPIFWDKLEASTAMAAESVLKSLSAAGAVLVECDLGINMEECTNAGMLIALYELLPCLEDYMRSHGLAFDPVEIAKNIASPDVRGIFGSLIGPDAPPFEAYQEALVAERPKFQKAYEDCFKRHQLEALIFPTTPLPAALIGEDDTVDLLGESVPTFMTFARNVGPGSVCGLPGVSLPMGLSSTGLPLGIALDGPRGSDRRLLEIAGALEALLPKLPTPAIFKV
jgi:indoleacetamide hydrolase